MKLIFNNQDKLTETTSLNLLTHLQSHPIQTSLTSHLIQTTFIQQGKSDIPLLLLHGFDSSVIEFRRLFPLFATKNETWAIDLLGFGFTERIADVAISALTIKTHLYYVWKTLIQRPVILVGASMGGAIALDFTLTYPDVVNRLVLIDSAGLSNPPSLGKFMFPPFDYLATAFLSNSWIRQKISESAYHKISFANQDALICTALHLNCSRWREGLISFTKSGGYGSFADQLFKITQPTLILWGKQDKILGTKPAFQFQQLLPHSQLIWLDNCGHVPHLEQPELTATNILEWMQRLF